MGDLINQANLKVIIGNKANFHFYSNSKIAATRATIKMSLPYDEAIFERRKWNYAAIFDRRQWSEIVSQRFRHICHRFRGTFRLAIQMTSTNFLLPTLPRSLAYVVFFSLLLFSFFLYILIYFSRSSEDPDLLEAMKSGRKILNSIGSGGLLLLFIALLAIWFFMIAEKKNYDDARLFAILFFLCLPFLSIIIKKSS